ncbi:MAG: ATP-binding protein [Cytophagales bacterium]|nr:ATP-binding protein [Cytophagales bacterium]MDW8383726.1 ATP-binding protein [Flammeovirgaceae bacterium]
MFIPKDSPTDELPLSELKRLVRGGENTEVEFKHKVADPLKIAKEVVAFANTKGGWLLLGVNDDKTIPGLKFPDEERASLEEELSMRCPQIKYKVWRTPITSSRDVLAFQIFESPQKPIFLWYNLRRKTGKAYYRVHDKSVQISKEMRKILQIRTHQRPQKPVRYGENEKVALQYVAQHHKINKFELASTAHISEEQAAEILITLTVNSILEIHPGDTLDYYTLPSVSL